jgi:hypothetical protein
VLSFFTHFFDTLDEIERDLEDKGYTVIYGGFTTFVVPSGNWGPPDKPFRNWHMALWPSILSASSLHGKIAHSSCASAD